MLGLLERLPFSLAVVVEGLIWRAGPIVIQLVVSLAIISGLIPFRYVLILAAVLAGYVVATWAGAVRHRVHANATNSASAAVSQTVGDVLRNARRVVLNGALSRELTHIDAQYGVKRHTTERMYWSLVTMSALQYGIVGLGLICLLVMGGFDVNAGRMTAGDFVLLQAYAFRLALPLSGFGYVLAQAGVSIANLKDALALTQTASDGGGPASAQPGAAAIDLEAVSFSYGAGLPGITDVNVRIAPASFVTIVGPNGSGKSTLAQLIAGVLAPTHGRVEINGNNLAGIARAERHGLVLYVPQFIGLFNRSLMDNALYPPTTLGQNDLLELLASWRFYEAGREIDFDIQLGEQGERLSGGQIQKLELARLAGVRVPAVILDESTSSLDPRSEAEVIGTLRRKYGAATTLIMITHRPGLVEGADQVLFRQAGELAGAGLHDDLLAQSEDYRRLWATTTVPA
jgi:ABC-type bacteriocin/lantibiotic exporter with double-glycine peptidase domain